MSWKQSGYGIHPFRGVNAPDVDVMFDGNSTAIVVKFKGELASEKYERLSQAFYDESKKLFNPPIIDPRSAAASDFNFDDLVLVIDELHKSFLDQFNGVTVRKDPFLKPNNWYCAVSSEIFDELHKKKVGN